MKVDHVLILAAGKGTRMGAIGEKLPKVIWPIFEKSLLELQVCFAREIAPEAEIYINVFNYKEKIDQHLAEKDLFKDVNILYENEEIDIGGAIHNLALSKEYNGNLLVLNSDQFLYIEKELIESSLKLLQENDSVLFTYDVDPKLGYNILDIRDDQFRGIIKNCDIQNKEKKYSTYSGMSLIKLNRLNKRPGKSNFFVTVANPIEKRIATSALVNMEYWDFGTLKRYYLTMFDVLEKRESTFFKFLEKNKAINARKIKSSIGYNSENGINLTEEYVEDLSGSILIKGRDNKKHKEIIYDDLSSGDLKL